MYYIKLYLSYSNVMRVRDEKKILEIPFVCIFDTIFFLSIHYS